MINDYLDICFAFYTVPDVRIYMATIATKPKASMEVLYYQLYCVYIAASHEFQIDGNNTVESVG